MRYREAQSGLVVLYYDDGAQVTANGSSVVCSTVVEAVEYIRRNQEACDRLLREAEEGK